MVEYNHTFAMDETDRVIDNMDVSDGVKRNIHDSEKINQERMLHSVGEVIERVFEPAHSPHVETTNQGLNLRVVVRENVDEIVAVAEKHGLTTIERSKTNIDSDLVWLRFKVLSYGEIGA